jgi:hypothetical protein
MLELCEGAARMFKLAENFASHASSTNDPMKQAGMIKNRSGKKHAIKPPARSRG